MSQFLEGIGCKIRFLRSFISSPVPCTAEESCDLPRHTLPSRSKRANAMHASSSLARSFTLEACNGLPSHRVLAVLASHLDRHVPVPSPANAWWNAPLGCQGRLLVSIASCSWLLVGHSSSSSVVCMHPKHSVLPLSFRIGSSGPSPSNHGGPPPTSNATIQTSRSNRSRSSPFERRVKAGLEPGSRRIERGSSRFERRNGRQLVPHEEGRDAVEQTEGRQGETVGRIEREECVCMEHAKTRSRRSATAPGGEERCSKDRCSRIVGTNHERRSGRSTSLESIA